MEPFPADHIAVPGLHPLSLRTVPNKVVDTCKYMDQSLAENVRPIMTIR